MVRGAFKGSCWSLVVSRSLGRLLCFVQVWPTTKNERQELLLPLQLRLCGLQLLALVRIDNRIRELQILESIDDRGSDDRHHHGALPRRRPFGITRHDHEEDGAILADGPQIDHQTIHVLVVAQINRNGPHLAIRVDLLLRHRQAVHYQFQGHLARIADARALQLPIGLLVVGGLADRLVRCLVKQRGYSIGALAIVTIVGLAAINCLGVRSGSLVQGVLMVLKVGALAALIVLGWLFHRPPPSAMAAPPDGLLAFGGAMVPVLFAYGGWQTTCFIASL